MINMPNKKISYPTVCSAFPEFTFNKSEELPESNEMPVGVFGFD
jgi:hypothetical protein